ncbi:MAG: DsbA family protein [Alphaproteobacteria bacterium]
MKKLVAISVCLLSLGTIPVYAEMNAADKTEVQNIVREYLLDNPEMLIEMQIALQKKEIAAQEAYLNTALDNIYANKDIPAIGNIDDPKLILTEFMDYACGYCKLMWPDLLKLTKEHPELQVKIVNIPILGHYSGQVAAYSTAFWQLYPEQWEQFHNELMTAKSQLSDTAIENLIKSLGGDWDKISKLAQEDAITSVISQNLDIADGANIQGTPFYAVGKTDIYRGAVGYDTIKQSVEQQLK